MKLEELFHLYRRSLVARAKASSLQQLDVHQRTLERHFGSSYPVEGLSLPRLDEFIVARRARVQPASINGSLGLLRSALLYARDAGELARLPVRVRMLKVGRRLPAVFSRTQVDALLARAPAPFDLMIMLAAYAGLRHQEILHLQRRDLTMTEIRVSAKPDWTPKSHHERAIPMAKRVAVRLEKQLAELNDKSPTAWVFPGRDGGPLKGAHVQIRKIFQAVGLYDPASKPGLHSLRKTWASTLLHGGVDLKTLQEMGGWADLKTLSEHYLVALPGSKEAAIATLERT
jgi:integrase/recombinase XerD